jgi:pilus assembly protein CpaC
MYDNPTGASVRWASPTKPARESVVGSAHPTWLVNWRHLWHVALVAACLATAAPLARAQDFGPTSPIRHISDLSEKLELTVNTSRILTLDKNIPRVQVNNPELLAVTPLSATQIQISAKKAGVTQVNLWDEEGNIHSVDVMIYGDARELEAALHTQFPNSSIKVFRYSESLVLKGFIDQPEYVSQIMRLAEDYAPKVINNMTVGGAQQVLLKVKVMEVSRTKLRRLGFDFAQISSGGVIAASSVSQLIAEVAQQTGNAAALTPNVEGGPGVIDNLGTFQFGIVNGDDVFFGFLDALQQNRIAKILAEPNLVAVSGRPAQFNVGGEFPILIPQSLGTTSVEFKPYGTQIDFVPIVLGNGNIRLEVRPRISEIDAARTVTLQGYSIPALTVRQVDTAVEMKAGQTFALAGLVQERAESVNRGLPYISDLPIIGVPFRKVQDEVNEIELLVLVTPEFVDAMNPDEVQCGGPGYFTTSPNNTDLYWGGHLEVPNQCNPIRGLTACGNTDGCFNNGCVPCSVGPCRSVTTDGLSMPGGVGYDDGYGPTTSEPDTFTDQPPPGTTPVPPGPMPVPQAMPPSQATPPNQPDDLPMPSPSDPPDGAGLQRPAPLLTSRPVDGPQYWASRPYCSPRAPVYVRSAPGEVTGGPASAGGNSGALIGPIGYDD